MGLSELYARLNNLNSRKRHLESEIRLYKKRLEEVKKLKTAIINTHDGRYYNINSNATTTAVYFPDGLEIEGSSTVATITQKIIDGLEKDSYGDTNIFCSTSELDMEITSINQKIDSLETELQGVNRSIAQTHSDIEAEKRRIAEEEARARAAKKGH